MNRFGERHAVNAVHLELQYLIAYIARATRDVFHPFTATLRPNPQHHRAAKWAVEMMDGQNIMLKC
jgi:tetrahydromethanopterin S-methyltransferase subunit C